MPEYRQIATSQMLYVFCDTDLQMHIILAILECVCKIVIRNDVPLTKMTMCGQYAIFGGDTGLM